MQRPTKVLVNKRTTISNGGGLEARELFRAPSFKPCKLHRDEGFRIQTFLRGVGPECALVMCRSQSYFEQ
jgi:hypothetical protein